MKRLFLILFVAVVLLAVPAAANACDCVSSFAFTTYAYPSVAVRTFHFVPTVYVPAVAIQAEVKAEVKEVPAVTYAVPAKFRAAVVKEVPVVRQKVVVQKAVVQKQVVEVQEVRVKEVRAKAAVASASAYGASASASASGGRVVKSKAVTKSRGGKTVSKAKTVTK